MTAYEERALEGASAIDLVVALYDGIIRFLQSASSAVKQEDVASRRLSVKKALDIILHLQSRLRMDIGGRPAQVLSDFYAAIFAQILQASHAASIERFEAAIGSVRNVRDAWRLVAHENRDRSSLPTVNLHSESLGRIFRSETVSRQSQDETPQWTA